jgi:diguanylate cyclase (GGDEF)-like protein
MPSAIRTIVNITGLFIAGVIWIGIPLGFGVEEYLEAKEDVAERASGIAAHIARHSLQIGPLWHLTVPHEEAVAVGTGGADSAGRVTLFRAAGELVFQHDVEPLPPLITAQAPVRLGGDIVGWVRAEESLRPVVDNVGVLALISTCLACAAFFAYRVLPLRVLDRTLQRLHSRNEELRARGAELRRQHMINEVALNNMSQGLCMFDADMRLVICNHRYASIYDLPARLTEPGTHLAEIIEHRVRTGNYTGTPEEYRAGRLAVAAGSEERTDVIEQKTGRVIEIAHRPLPAGGWVATHEDITERRRAEARVAYLATHDGLTDLPNRVLFREKLEEALGRVSAGAGFAVHCLDLDRFKDVNDTLGHPVGDALLQEVARRLRREVRDGNVVARLGGDEFAVIQCDVRGPEAASALAQRIIQVVAEPFAFDGDEVRVAASVGVALSPGDGVEADQLMKNADLALYRAKAEGRGISRFFEAEMDARLQARRLFETELRAALGKGEFELVYQPVYNLRADAVSGFEALLRWRHPTRGLISPAEFIPVAEETGMIGPLGEWVLRTACGEAAAWPDPVRVAVNLSAVQFRSRNLVGAVMSALAAARLPPGRLELEVTESVLLLDSDATRATLHKLRELGVRIAMDDFGTGYSSLSYLRSFPFDRIKIDRSFVQELSSGSESVAIVHAIAELACKLGMETTAEGVETEEQLMILRAEACTEIQGYLISAPKPAAELAAVLARCNGTGTSMAGARRLLAG